MCPKIKPLAVSVARMLLRSGGSPVNEKLIVFFVFVADCAGEIIAERSNTIDKNPLIQFPLVFTSVRIARQVPEKQGHIDLDFVSVTLPLSL